MSQNVFSIIPKLVPPLSLIPIGGESMNVLLGIVSITCDVAGRTRVKIAMLPARLKIQVLRSSGS